MNKSYLSLLCCGVTALAAAVEPIVPAPITGLTLFKNGLAVVERVAKPGPGPFLIDEEIEPLHGTLWFSPADGLTVARVNRRLSTPNYQPFNNFTATYENCRVTVELQSYGNQPAQTLTGTVVNPVKARPPKRFGNRQEQIYVQPFLTLKLDSGELVTFQTGRIASIQAASIRETLEVERPVWLFNSRIKMAGPMYINYLTRGVTWAPSYRLALGPEAKLQIDQSAVISNELADLKDVNVNLVSGFPNIRCADVTSPMSTKFDLNTFFSQLSGGMGYARDSSMMMNQARVYEALPVSAKRKGLSPLPESGATEDIQITSAGKVTLAAGDALYLPLASAEASYERLVEWNIPDNRNEYGRPLNRDSQTASGELWDAVRFKNPFERAITSSPVEIVDGDKVLGQSETGWVNPGESTVVKITKALTVVGKAVEYEAAGVPKADSSLKRINEERIVLAGYTYRKPEVIGELTLKNYRRSNARVLVNLEFSGELISADGNPKRSMPERGIYSVNQRNRLEWEVELKPGEELKLNYKYSVLVRL